MHGANENIKFTFGLVHAWRHARHNAVDLTAQELVGAAAAHPGAGIAEALARAGVRLPAARGSPHSAPGGDQGPAPGSGSRPSSRARGRRARWPRQVHGGEAPGLAPAGDRKAGGAGRGCARADGASVPMQIMHLNV